MSIVLPFVPAANSAEPLLFDARRVRQPRRRKPLHKEWWFRWPLDPTDELDGDRWEPVSGLVTTTAAMIEAAPYEVFSITGRALDRFADRSAAVAAMHRWPTAMIVSYRGQTVARKEQHVASVGEIARAA
jgi:hypothetical protein